MLLPLPAPDTTTTTTTTLIMVLIWNLFHLNIHGDQVCKENYSKGTSWTLWVMTELAIIGCDLQEIIGSATAFQVMKGGS